MELGERGVIIADVNPFSFFWILHDAEFTCPLYLCHENSQIPEADLFLAA
jgi:hypothetical protein